MTAEASAGRPWSPANNPYSIAVSEAYWALGAVHLCARRIRDGNDPARQIDARQCIIALAQLLLAARMEKKSILELDLGLDDAMRELTEAIDRFQEQLPDVVNARNQLMHFDEYATGIGVRQRPLIAGGIEKTEVARQFWGGGYDPDTGIFREGLYEIHIEKAAGEARRLNSAIGAAARAVDQTAVGAL